MSDELPIMKQVDKILETHGLACGCSICTAFIKGATAYEGMMQAADELRYQRDAGMLEKRMN